MHVARFDQAPSKVTSKASPSEASASDFNDFGLVCCAVLLIERDRARIHTYVHAHTHTRGCILSLSITLNACLASFVAAAKASTSALLARAFPLGLPRAGNEATMPPGAAPAQAVFLCLHGEHDACMHRHCKRYFIDVTVFNQGPCGSDGTCCSAGHVFDVVCARANLLVCVHLLARAYAYVRLNRRSREIVFAGATAR